MTTLKPKPIMMREVVEVRQIAGEPRRRWFTNDYFDLVVWQSREDDGIVAFQLSYDKRGYERALSWDGEQGYGHNRVDDGEDRPGRLKATPILVVDGLFDHRGIAARFEAESADLDPDLTAFVLQKLLAFGERKRGDE